MTGTPQSSRSAGPTQLAYAEITAAVTVSAVAEAAPNDVVSSGAVTYDGTRICIEFYSPEVTVAGTAGSFTILNLWDDVTELGRIAVLAHASGTQPMQVATYAQRYLTPTAGSHTYKIRAWRVNANGTVGAGDGTAGNDHPAFIRVVQAPS